MRRCHRCRSTMLLDYGDTLEAYQQVWKCMGCGREMLHDTKRQDEEDRQFGGVTAEIVRKQQG
jgi:transposase-like protein